MNFDALTKYLDSLHTVGVPGCDLAIYRDHEPVYRHMAGHRDAAGAEPVSGDELYWLYSCTKVFTTCAAMQLIDRGALSLDDPVSAYLPAFGSLTVREGDAVRPARRVMTVRHLMSMQSGLDYDMTTPAAQAELERTKGLATQVREEQRGEAAVLCGRRSRPHRAEGGVLSGAGREEEAERSGKRPQQAPVREQAGIKRQAYLRQVRPDAEAVCESAGGAYGLAVQAEGAGEEDGFP